MKFLDAQKQDGNEPKASILPENKMQSGSRLDQKDPQSLISGSRGARTTNTDTVKTANAPKPTAAVTSLATELNVDLKTVTGTGPNGAITEQDVRTAATK
jgi:pyruvate/2-oxoglutarate dehydrogenase complex dihydrolipoamide acyltransferase (E2) component